MIKITYTIKNAEGFLEDVILKFNMLKDALEHLRAIPSQILVGKPILE